MDEDHLDERGSTWRGCLHDCHSGDVLLNNKLSFWPLRAAPTVAASLNAPRAALIPQMCCCCLTIDESSRGSAVEAAFCSIYGQTSHRRVDVIKRSQPDERLQRRAPATLTTLRRRRQLARKRMASRTALSPRQAAGHDSSEPNKFSRVGEMSWWAG